jgi:hypothetical protein
MADRGLDLGMTQLADVTEGGGQVVRTDEHRVDARHGQDRVEIGESLAGLDLDAARDEIVRGSQVRDRSPTVAGCTPWGDPAQAGRRVTAPRDGTFGVGDCPDLRHDHARRPGVQGMHDPDGLVRPDPVQDRHPGCACGDQDPGEVRGPGRSMLAIDDEEVEAGSGDELRHGRIEERDPRPEREPALGDPWVKVGDEWGLIDHPRSLAARSAGADAYQTSLVR